MAGRRGAPEDDAPSERQRIDKWLVYARFVKTRAAASVLVEDGRVRLNGVRMSRPDRAVRAGDVLTLALPHATQVVRITGLAERRGGATVAQALYEDIGG
ncbi:MAG: RNA-binding S4 domain-containing protein [Alsobacter sp.]